MSCGCQLRRGLRFDGYGIDENGTVVLDLFRPGAVCRATRSRTGSYAVALERRFVGDLPFAVAVRRAPRDRPVRLIPRDEALLP
ncbi:MAG: hypothetical protein R2710_19465 [Acidimicrobiales bacterium]